MFTVDNHGLQGTGTSAQSYSVTDVPPTISSGTQYSVSDITLVPADSTDKPYTVTVTDDNGGSDLVSATGVLYDADAVGLTSGTCEANERNCYPDVTCVAGTPSGANLSYTCDFTVWFNAYASDASAQGWRFHVNPADGQGPVTDLPDSDTGTVPHGIQVNALQAINVTDAQNSANPSIAYGQLYFGGISAGLPVTIQNYGNQPIDTLIQGTDMQNGGGASILAAQQKWNATVQNFDYASSGNALVTNAASAHSAAEGCADLDEPVRADHASGSGSDKTLFWKIQIPLTQDAGIYSGANTFAAAAVSQCSDGE